MQQVHAFERRMFEILCSKIPHEINYWQRWADGCSGQFRSQFCNASCIRAKDDFGLQTVSWQYFEAHEGKNLSDTLGSIAKCEVKRQMAQYSHGVQTAADVVTLLHKGVSESTKKFNFLHIEEFPSLARIPSKERDSYPVEKIMSMHSIRTIPNGSGLLAQHLTCLKCTTSKFCETCEERTTSDENNNDNDEYDYDEMCTANDSGSDSQSEYDSEDVYEAEFKAGDVVWGKYGKTWYPAKVCAVTELPVSLLKKLKGSYDLIPLKWYVENTFSLIRSRFVDVLAQNRVDEARASKSAETLQKYNEAVSDLRND